MTEAVIAAVVTGVLSLIGTIVTVLAVNNPITVIYPLTNPLIYQLSATEIKSLLGINNVWSDAGDMDVEYRADTKLYIDKKLGV